MFACVILQSPFHILRLARNLYVGVMWNVGQMFIQRQLIKVLCATNIRQRPKKRKSFCFPDCNSFALKYLSRKTNLRFFLRIHKTTFRLLRNEMWRLLCQNRLFFANCKWNPGNYRHISLILIFFRLSFWSWSIAAREDFIENCVTHVEVVSDTFYVAASFFVRKSNLRCRLG